MDDKKSVAGSIKSVIDEKNTADTQIIQVSGLIEEMIKECPPFWKNSNLLKLYLWMIPGCIMPAVAMGYDSAMMNGLQSVAVWDEFFNHPRGALLGLLTSFLPLGAIVGCLFISPLSSRWGRKMGIAGGGGVMAVGGIVQACSQNFATFLVSRFIIGFGIIIANSFAPILISELAHPKERQILTSLYQSSYFIGAIIAAWTTFGTFAMTSNWGWRIPSVLQVPLAGVLCVFVWMLPESPRWLIANGKSDQAKAILIKYHANGNELDEFTNLEFQEMNTVIQEETQSRTTWTSFLQSPSNRRRTLLIAMLGLFCQWSGNGLTSYYLTRVLVTIGVTSHREQTIINGCVTTFNWLAALFAASMTVYLKRRTQFLLSVGGMLAAFSMQSLGAGLFNEKHDIAAGRLVLACLFIFAIFYNMGFNALLYSYSIEILPYHMRAKGLALLMIFGKASVFVNSFVNPIGLQYMGWKYYLVYVGWLCIELAMIYFFIIETKGPTLEAIREKFDKLDRKTESVEVGDDRAESQNNRAVL